MNLGAKVSLGQYYSSAVVPIELQEKFATILQHGVTVGRLEYKYSPSRYWSFFSRISIFFNHEANRAAYSSLYQFLTSLKNYILF